MKLTMTFASVLFFAASAMAAEKNLSKTTTIAAAPAPAAAVAAPTVSTTVSAPATTHNTVAFNFVGLSQGKTNLYLDIGGMSETVSPALSFRAYSNKEKVKSLEDREVTVDRSLATVGASITLLKNEGKSLLLNPYLYFGTQKNLLETENKSGAGVRLVGQVNLNKTIALQGGIDGNNMEETFKNDIYVGVAFAL
ncbi:hypothetical protein [Bdellovibrio sp. HCB337]|uniref:hypothetical protein n=1 Tax=Bdellovibrio sp. HCB337 TaxID=3394358 RepID=UPI0039A72CAB